MTRIQKLLIKRTRKEVMLLLQKAHAFVLAKKERSVIDIQNYLHIDYEEAVIIHDLFLDKYFLEPKLSYHWVRCARRYARNNISPSLTGMCSILGVGDRRGYLLMLELEKKKIIKIKEDFSFAHVKHMATFDELVGQMKTVARKYRNRCEPELLMRRLYVDEITAFRLAQYGQENLDLKWKRKARE